MTCIRLLALLVFLASASLVSAQDACAPDAGLEFICGAINPEDLVQVPGTPLIISSGMAEGAGFYLVDSTSNALRTLTFGVRHDATTYPDCAVPPSPQTLNTHGLNIRATGPGSARLQVVGHGAREAIEIFQVDSTATGATLTWTGCVLMPEGLEANSVASLADGTLFATVLFMPGKTFAEAVVERRNTGAVFKWSPGDSGFTLIEGSELPANNGIEVAADGSEFYVVSSGLQNVVAFANSNPTRQLRASQPLPFTPDNVHMGPDGRLYTAGMANDVPECGGPPGPQHDIAILSACPRGTIAVALDPVTMAHSIILQTPASAYFSNATMVLPVGEQLWIGTFAGNRLARTQ